MIEAPADTYARIFPDPKPQKDDSWKEVKEWQSNPCSEIPLGTPTACAIPAPDYDPRDQIIANLSIENEILRKRLKEIHQASADIRDALDAARDKFARLREYNYY